MSENKMDPQLKFATSMTVVVALGLFLIKLFAFQITGSQAIFSEAMESIVNVVAALITFVVIYYAAKPADKDHPYGHGKVEFISAAIEGTMIAFAAFLIMIEAVQALYKSSDLQSLDFGLGLLALTGVVNLVMGFYLKRVGKKKNSAALQASAAHLMADFWTSAGVILGLSLVFISGIDWIDRVIAIIVGLHLIREAYDLIRKSLGGLLDEEETGLLKHINRIINDNGRTGIIQVHHLRVMRSGNYHHIDAHIVVPEFWSVEHAHDETLAYERQLFDLYEYSGEFHFHIDPCRRLYCEFCDLKECPVRQEPFKARRQMSIEELTAKDEPTEVTKKINK